MNRKLLLIPVLLIWGLSRATTPNWAQDVAPVLYAHCTSCHHAGGIGPFPLITYSDASTHAGLMSSAISSGLMPPWPPDTNFQRFVHERILSAAEANTIIAWAAAGEPVGNIAAAPSQPVYNNATQLDTVNLSFVIPTYTVSGTGDVYRNFPIASGLSQSMYVTAIEVIPGNAAIVHHVLLYQDSTNVPFQLQASNGGGSPGYTDAGGTGSNASVLLNGWAPGSSPYYTPVGTGFRLPANTNFVVQVHYPNGSQGQTDSTRINLKLTSIPQRNISVVPILNYITDMTNGPINIPANTTKTYYEKYTVPADVTTLAVFPHMHLIGEQIKAWGNAPGTNDTIPFISIPDWNFHWQGMYAFQNAIHVPRNTVLNAEAYYDNTSNNPNNPNYPPQTIVAGEATTNEMMLVFFAYLPYQNGDTNLIIDKRVIPQGSTTLCSGQSVILQTIIGPHYTYQWFKNGSSISGATGNSYAASQPGSYYVQISLGPNTTVSNVIAVSSGSAPVATVNPSGAASLCSGASLTLNAGTGNGYTYQWYKDSLPVSGAVSSSYSVSTAGNYSLVVYNGCYAQSSIVPVTTASAPSATVTPNGATTFCQGGSVTLSAPAGLSYVWSNSSTSQNITVNQNGSYTVTVTNSGNCSAVSSATTVTVNALPSATISAGGPTSFCTGQNVTLSGPAGLTYSWSNQSTTQNITVSAAGSYTLTVTNNNSCTAVSVPQTVTVHSLPTASITPAGPTSFCNGGSVVLNAGSSSSYHWSNGSTTQSVTANQSGNYTLTVTDANACSNSATITVQVYAMPDTSITTSKPTTICPGDTVAISAASGLNYHWSNGATTQTVNAWANGSFDVTVTDNHSCTAVSSPVTVTVSNNAQAQITPSGATTFCAGGSVLLTASSGASYSWSNGASAQSITINTAGSYTVTVIMGGSCVAIATPVIIVVNPAPITPSVTPAGATIFCAGGNVNLSAPSGYTYLWSNGASAQNIQVTQAGNYTVTVTDANTCSASSNALSVVVNPLPTVTFSAPGSSVCSNLPAFALSGGSPAGGVYSGNGVTAGMFDPAVAGVGTDAVTYTYTDNNSCINTASASIVVNICTGISETDASKIVLSPNPSDGNFFVDWSKGDVAVEHVAIYDLQGRLIFEQEVNSVGKQLISVTRASAGCYIIQLKTTDGLVYRKITVQ